MAAWLLNLGFAGGTAGSDSTPDAFSFTDLTSQAVGTVISSNVITVTGIDTSSPVTFVETGHLSGEYSLNSGAWTDLGNFNVNNNDTLQLRLTSSASEGQTHSITVTIGGVSDQWDVTTVTTWTEQTDDTSTWTVQADDSSVWTDQ